MHDAAAPGSIPDRPETDRVRHDDATLRLDAEVQEAAARAEPPVDDGAMRGVRIGRYEISELLGRGGMGTVYRAMDVELRREVALKILPPSVAYRADGRRAFLDEARAMARIDHPSVVRIHEAVEDAGYAALAMELVDGGTLADMVRAGEKAQEFEGRRPGVADVLRCFAGHECALGAKSYPAWVARVGLQVAEALGALHARGLLHRDVKSSNVFVDRSGRVRLGDFGIAVDPQSSSASPPCGLGTPGYAAPEQLRERSDLDRRVDVFGLGATLYELCALRTPASGSQTAIVEDLEFGRVPALRQLAPDVPADLANIIHRAIEPDRERRYPTVSELADDLRAFLEHRPVKARPASVLRRARFVLRRHSTRVALAAASVAVVGLAAVVIPGLQDERQRERDAQVSRHVHLGLAWLDSMPTRQRALREFERARALDRSNPLGLAGLAIAWSELGHPDRAVELLESEPELVARHAALAHLLEVGARMHVRTQEESRRSLVTSTDPLDHFLEGVIALQRASTSLNPEYYELARRLLRTALDESLLRARDSRDYDASAIYATTFAAALAKTDQVGDLDDLTRTTLNEHHQSWVVALRLATVWIDVDVDRAVGLLQEARRRGADEQSASLLECRIWQRTAMTAGDDDERRKNALREALRCLQPMLEGVPEAARAAADPLGVRDHGWDEILGRYAMVLQGLEGDAAAGRVRQIHDRAVDLLESAIAALDGADPHTEEGALQIDLRLRLATFAADFEDWERCLRCFDECVELAPESPEVWMRSGQFWVFRHRAAVRDYRQAAADGHADPAALAAVQALEQRARTQLERSVELAPQHAAAIQNLALFLYDNGYYGEAREFLPQLQGLHDDLADTRVVHGIVESWCGHPREAAEILEDALAELGGTTGVLELARSLHEIREYDRAIDRTMWIVEDARVVRDDVERPVLERRKAANRLARAQAIEARARVKRGDAAAGDQEKARSLIDAAVRATRASNGEILHAKGLVLGSLGEPQAAIRAFEEAITAFHRAADREPRRGRHAVIESLVQASEAEIRKLREALNRPK